MKDWLLGLSLPDRKTIGAEIKTVEYGWPLGMPLVRKLESGLWEVRVNIKDGIARILFAVKDDMMVLLHGFVKKSQKTPTSELNTAKQRMKDI